MLGQLKEYARFAKPRTVLWLFYEGNDLHDLTVERRNPQLMHYLGSGALQGLRDRQSEIDQRLLRVEQSSRSVRTKIEDGLRGLFKLRALRERLRLNPLPPPSRMPTDQSWKNCA